MRLDLFLKRCGLLKRRTLSKQACDIGLVLLDGRPAKPAYRVNVGQRVTLSLPGRVVTVEILNLPQSNVSRVSADQFYRILSDVIPETLEEDPR
jgi:ribosomal 50S subunit-recycling heat shock protein